MKMKKLSLSAKFLIAALVTVMVAAAVFGVSSIFAEPTIEDLAAEHIHEIGTFKPNALYDPDTAELDLVDLLNTTQIMFSYDWWTDSNGDGTINSDDVYGVEGFEHQFLMQQIMYPVFSVGDDADYYIVAFPDYALYNDSVVIQIQVAENNDYARLYDTSKYWFDRENNHLYIAKEVLEDALKNQEIKSIRIETTMLVKSIPEATKKINIYSLFDANIDNTHGMYNAVPNTEYDQNINEWLNAGLKYQLVQPKHLAYVSADNLTVYVNGSETDNWVYDETTGMITINSSPYLTTDVAVKFNALIDADAAEQTLQMFQTNASETVGQATTFEEALTGNNMFLHYLQYEEEGPQIGTFQELGFQCFSCINSDGSVTVWQPGWTNNTEETYVSAEGTPVKIVQAAVRSAIKSQIDANEGRDGQYFDTPTLAAWIGNPGYNQTAGSITKAYGEVVYNMFLAYKNDDLTKLNEAVQITQDELLCRIGTSGDWNYYEDALSAFWLTAGHEGRYMLGTMKDEFLGGKLNFDSGHAFFDATCAQIWAPSMEAYADMKAEWGEVDPGRCMYDYRGNATIVGINPNDEGTGGYLYVCIWSKSLVIPKDYARRQECQKILAFSRVPYQFTGGGTFMFSKIDEETGEPVIGAVYGIYKDAACTIEACDPITTTAEPFESPELPSGAYYVKEISAPAGYLLDTEVHIISVTGGEPANIVVTDKKQQCVITVTVYDETTEKDYKPGEYDYRVPVPGVKFELYNPENKSIMELVSNENGRLVDADGNTSITVPAIGIYTLRQTDTVVNYRMDMNQESRHYCGMIDIDASPSTSGSNIHRDLVHYEQRQTVIIHSHVQDTNLLENTPANLGGSIQAWSNPSVSGGMAMPGELETCSSVVATLGAQYQLRTESEILLGYVNGRAITVDSGQVLKIKTKAKDNTYTYSTVAYACVMDGIADKAYVIAEGVEVEYGGSTYTFPLPNGSYVWELVQASEGYWNNRDLISTLGNKFSMQIDATWNRDNRTVAQLKLEDPVFEERQQVAITLYVKAYDAKNRTVYKNGTDGGARGNSIRDREPTVLRSRKEANDMSGIWTKYIVDDYDKDVFSDQTVVTSDSIEEATLYENGEVVMEVSAEHLAPNAIYELTNLIEIVNMNGQIIPAGTALGWYITDDTGSVRIDHMGTEAIDNPNEKSQGAYPHFGQLIPLDKYNQSASGPLPNGIYALTYVLVPDDHQQELGLSEDVLSDQILWHTSSSDVHILETEALVLLFKQDPEDNPIDVPVAPDPDPDCPDDPDDPDDDPPEYRDNPEDKPDPEDPDGVPDPTNPFDPDNPVDPYDPDHPDDPSDPDDSSDIPLVPKSWVDNHQYEYAYRIVDPDNLNAEGIRDVSDTLPTPFAFYVKPLIDEDLYYTYGYDLSFYYEISEAEFNAAPQEAKDNFEYVKIDIDRQWTDTNNNGNADFDTDPFYPSRDVYARRFSTESLTGGYALDDIIAINENSNGRETDFVTIKENATISAAIDNITWINDQLSAQTDGEFNIYVCIDVHVSYETKFSEKPIELGNVGRAYGILHVKNRMLVPLD